MKRPLAMIMMTLGILALHRVAPARAVQPNRPGAVYAAHGKTSIVPGATCGDDDGDDGDDGDDAAGSDEAQ